MTSETTDLSGLKRAKALCATRDLRARQLSEQGKKVIGYFCSYSPVELLTALDMVPFRIMGSVREPVTRADAHLEPIACPFVRSSLDQALKGRFDFLSGVLFPHSCDNVQHLSGIWEYNLKPGFHHFLNVPHMIQPSSFAFFEAELRSLQERLEELAGRKMTHRSLLESIRMHNRNRALMRSLYAFRKQQPPKISGAEVLEVMAATLVLPAGEQTRLLESVIEQIDMRPTGESDEKPRLMIYGCEMDSPDFVRMVEDTGAHVVMDDLCIGSRGFWVDVEETPDPIQGLARHYLGELHCPRTYRPSPGSHREDLENRFGYLKAHAEQFGVNGVVLYIIRYCDTHEFDAPNVRDYLQGIGLPVLHLEDDYTLAGIEGLRTRLQAFVEMLL